MVLNLPVNRNAYISKMRLNDLTTSTNSRLLTAIILELVVLVARTDSDILKYPAILGNNPAIQRQLINFKWNNNQCQHLHLAPSQLKLVHLLENSDIQYPSHIPRWATTYVSSTVSPPQPTTPQHPPQNLTET